MLADIKGPHLDFRGGGNSFLHGAVHAVHRAGAA